jgi:hypothetical protein
MKPNRQITNELRGVLPVNGIVNGESVVVAWTKVDQEDAERFGNRSVNFLQAGTKYVKIGNTLLHRAIMGAKKGEVVDHINHNTLDNRKCNLRICTQSQNHMNRKGAQVNSTTGELGVHWDSKLKKFRARLQKDGKTYNFGQYKNIDDAIAARRAAAADMFGEFAPQV